MIGYNPLVKIEIETDGSNHLKGKAIAYIDAPNGREEIGILSFRDTNDSCAHLTGLYISLAYRGQGIATRLNIEVIDHITTFGKCLTLIARSSNPQVNKILTKLGFNNVKLNTMTLFYKEIG